MKFLIILSLMICSLKAETDSCSEYKPAKNINECFSKKTYKHHACCGLHISTPYNDYMRCMMVGNTNAEKNYLKQNYELASQQSGGKYDFQCPAGDEEIKGTCEEFKGIGVDDPKKCTKLKVKYTKDRRTCCGLTMKYRQDSSDIPFYSCVDFSINKKQREASIAEMNNDPRGSTYISDCTC